MYRLRQLSDFGGRYTAWSAGAGVLRGGSAMTMHNDAGVVIRMTSSAGGVDLDLGGKVLSFSFQ